MLEKNNILEKSDILEKNESSLVIEPLNVLEIIKGDSQEIKNGSICKLKSLIEKDPNSFKDFVLKELSTTKPFTEGREGVIYKIDIENKQCIILKKRFNNISKEECLLHLKAFSISQESNSGVKVPELFYEFSDRKNGYLIMEFMNGKTLFTMIFEKMVNSELILFITELINKKVGEGNIHLSNLFFKLSEFKKQYSDGKGNIIFNNDYESINGIEFLINILFELGYGNFNVSNSKNNRDLIGGKLLDDFLGKIKVFNENDKEIIMQKIKIFLDDLHKNGFYHMDLGENLRNIILNGTEVSIIDFGASVISGEDYENNDYNILTEISNL